MMKRNLPARFGFTVLAGLLAVIALAGAVNTRSASAAGATLSLPSVSCTSNNATVAFQWQQLNGASAQYLDLSIQDDTFVRDSFASTPVNGSSFTWSGLQPGSIYWWRINSNTSAGWQPSAAGAFVPCGNPQPLAANATCADANNANIDFHWAPMAGPNGGQFIDIGQDGNFPAGSYQGAGPIQSGANSYRWSNVKANLQYYYRINQQQSDGTWKASPVKSFLARCGATGSTIAAAQTSLNPNIYGSSDRLLIPGLATGSRCGASVNAPVNVRDVPADGALGDPAADCDVVRYDFKLFPGYTGYPGDGGATVIAGHLDYSLTHEGGVGSVIGVAQYWKQLRKGDTIQYQRGDGKLVTYQVSWTAPVPLGSDFDYSTLARQASTETLALITCGGTWNAAAHEYEERTVVYALRVS